MANETITKTVLVVDDEPDICEALEMALALEGYKVKAALDRDEALRVIDEHHPVLILLDYRMPGLDAGDFVAQLRAHNDKAPVILMTAGKDPFEMARQLGLKHYLAKPFELDMLLDLVKKCINEPEEA